MRQDTPVTEVGARLYMSAWRPRLWTYQEGALTARVLLLVADGLVDVDVLIKAGMTRDEDQNSIQHNLVDTTLEDIVE